MGWLDTPEDRRRQNVHVVAGGNIRDLDRIHERDRRRTINGLFWFFFIMSGLFGFILYKIGFVKQSVYLFSFALLFLIILIFRYGLHRKLKSGKSSYPQSSHSHYRRYRNHHRRHRHHHPHHRRH